MQAVLLKARRKPWRIESVQVPFFFEPPTVTKVNGKDVKRVQCLLCTQQHADSGRTSNRPFPLRRNGMQLYMTSRLGCLRWPAGMNFTLLYMGTWPTFRRLLLRVQEKYRAALAPIQSSSIDLFNSGRSNSVRLCLTLDRAVRYHRVHYSHEGLLSASGAVELVKTSKMCIYTYHLLVTT